MIALGCSIVFGLPLIVFIADRKTWVMLQRKAFHDPPMGRNRVWQTDFSEFETIGGGVWWICAVIDYATKYCMAASGPGSRSSNRRKTRNRLRLTVFRSRCRRAGPASNNDVSA